MNQRQHRKYDPSNKAALLKANRHIENVCQLMVTAAAAQLSPKLKAEDSASRARATEDSKPLPHAQARAVDPQKIKRGRRRILTPEKVQQICELIATGETECGACIRVGIGLTAWSVAKRFDASLRERIAIARDEWARTRHLQYAATAYESQIARSAGRKAIPPQPTRQVKWVCHYLTVTVPLNLPAIPPSEIEAACALCSLSLASWQRQERTFSLLRKVYQKRAAIRGQQPVMIPAPVFSSDSSQVEDDPFDVFRA